MKEYKRLTERDMFGNADIIGLSTEKLYSELCFSETNLLTKALNKLAYLEDKIENGTLIELPCKVGDTIYTIQNAPIMHIEVVESIQIYSNKIKFITKDRFNGGFWHYYLEDFGEIAFTIKAEAEAKSKELKGEL